MLLPLPDNAPALSEYSAPDVVALLLADKRSVSTQRAYAADLRDFFGGEYSREIVAQFLALDAPQIALALARYKASLHERQAAEATINRRLAAVKSLLKFAHRLGLCATDGRNLVDGEKVVKYRDTRGVDVKTLKKLLAQPAKSFPENATRRLRDTAILTLLIENALRRAELCKLSTQDFEPATKTLWILGKGRGTQRERITLSANCTRRIAEYSEIVGAQYDAPLFRSLDHRSEYSGARLTPDGLYRLIGDYGRAVGLSRLTPHQLRHSAITAALDATKGDVRKVQKLSRHAKIETLMIYDDSRTDAQGEMSSMLSELLG